MLEREHSGEAEGCSQKRARSGEEEEEWREGGKEGADSKGNLTSPL